MNLDRYIDRRCFVLGAATALAVSIALANSPDAEATPAQSPVTLAAAERTDAVADGSRAAIRRSFPSSEAGVRRAAAQGSEALRRYIYRTRMIYNYYFWDFAKRE
jgi:hypothetical protein